MEALTGVSVALLTIYDMCKAIDKRMEIGEIHLDAKNRGGKERGICAMIDGYGRTIDYVRISVTDRCNLRCVYCMPEEGIGSISHEEILRFGEIERVCQILAENGIQKIKADRRRTAGAPETAGVSSSVKTDSGNQEPDDHDERCLLEEMYDALADAGLIQSRSAWIRWMRRCTGSSHAGMSSKRSDAVFGRRSRKAGCRSR